MSRKVEGSKIANPDPEPLKYGDLQIRDLCIVQHFESSCSNQNAIHPILIHIDCIIKMGQHQIVLYAPTVAISVAVIVILFKAKETLSWICREMCKGREILKKKIGFF